MSAVNPRARLRTASLTAAVAAAAVALTGLSALPAAAAATTCPIASDEFSWGFNEDFRSYVETIAMGEWILGGNVQDQTGGYVFAGGTGQLDGDGVGTLAFTASIQFTGHEGALNTTISNPVIDFTADGAYLLLDIDGVTQQGDAIALAAVRFATVDIAAATFTDGAHVVTIADAPVTLTEEGAAAFGTYPAGESLDALTLVIGGAPSCASALAADAPAPVATPSPTVTTLDGEPTGDANGGSGLGAWAWGIIAALVAGGAGAAIAFARKRS